MANLLNKIVDVLSSNPPTQGGSIPRIPQPLPKNYLSYKDPFGPELNNRTTKNIDPSLIQEIVRQGVARGYGKEFPVALAGAETNFGTKSYGPTNPMSYGWKNTQAEIDKMLTQTDAYKKAKQHTANLVAEGFPLKHALAMEEYAQERYVKPALSIQKSFDTLDEKKAWLIKNKHPVDPAHLSWAYQGTGKINKAEAPRGFAYGKPVAKTSPTSDHARIVGEILGQLKQKGNPLGEFVRGIR